MRKCPYCAEDIEWNSIICEYCGETLTGNNHRKNSDNNFFMKIFKNWSYIWNVIVNIFVIFVVFGIYDTLYDSFEIIVVSILIILYSTIRSIGIGYAIQKPLENLAILGEFRKIRGLLNGGNVSEDDEEEKVKIIEANKKTQRQQIKMYIDIGFIFLIYIISIVKLIGEVL